MNYKSGFPTSPGTEMKVTPESAVPIIPKATKYHFEFLLALKNASLLLSFLLITLEIKINTPKYRMIIVKIAVDDINEFFVCAKIQKIICQLDNLSIGQLGNVSIRQLSEKDKLTTSLTNCHIDTLPHQHIDQLPH